MCGAFAAGDISGAAFNPAVAVGGTLIGLMSPTMLAIYLAGDFLGGAAAAAVFKAVAGDGGQ
jgi:aquaporin Z